MQSQEVYIIDEAADSRLLLKHIFTRFLSQYKTRFFASGNALHEYLSANSDPVNQNSPGTDESGESTAPAEMRLTDRPGESRPGLILLDLNMPGLSGYQTLVRLKQSAWKAIPVVMMTSEASDEEVEQCYEAGASSFVIKPIGIEPMKQLMNEVCQHWLHQQPVAENTALLNSLR